MILIPEDTLAEGIARAVHHYDVRRGDGAYVMLQDLADFILQSSDTEVDRAAFDEMAGVPFRD